MKSNELPIGFVMALAQNDGALKKFDELNDMQKEALVNKTKKINSKRDMKSFVDSLSEGTLNI